MFFIILIFTIILLSIFECIFSPSMHLILHPMSKISLFQLNIKNKTYSAVLPFITTISCNLIFIPISFVSTSLDPHIFSFTVFLAVSKLPFKYGSFWPNFLPFSMLLSIKPFSSICRPIFILIDSITVHFILEELTFKEIAIV